MSGQKVRMTRLLLREIRWRRWGFAASGLVVAIAVAVFVALLSMSNAALRTNVRLLRDMGFNVLILPQGAELDRHWALDFGGADMPEDYAQRLAERAHLADHFVAKLQQTVPIAGRTVVLTGVLPEKLRAHKTRKKTPMPQSYVVARGEVYLGAAVAASTGAALNSAVDVLGRELRVARVLPETGTLDDIRIFAHLHDAQGIVGKPGRINAIDALGCACSGGPDLLAEIEGQIREILPETQVTHYRSIATAREQARRLFDSGAQVALAVTLLLGALAIVGLTLANVRQRRHEIGVMRAVGVRTTTIGRLFSLKILCFAAPGSVLGFAAGALVAAALGPSWLSTPVPVAWGLLGWSTVLAPALALLFGLLPVLHGLALDPTRVLQESA